MGITKRYRLVIDYELEVSDFEPYGWHGPKFYTDSGIPGFNEWAENQRRLFDAVMKDPKRVEQMCQRSVLDALETDIDDVRHQFAVPAEDDLYSETFAEMSPQDRAYWENICREELFAENADFVTYRFQPSVRSCTMQNVETGEFIEMQPDRPEAPFAELLDEETDLCNVEAFGTWAEPEPERYEPDAKKLEEMRKQVSLGPELPDSSREFLQLFVIHRTVFSYVDTDTPKAPCSDEEIIRVANEWVASNPVLSKQDLSCLKKILRELGISNLFRHNFVQDMRKKTFNNMCQTVLQHERVLTIKHS